MNPFIKYSPRSSVCLAGRSLACQPERFREARGPGRATGPGASGAVDAKGTAPMPNERAGGPGNRGSTAADLAGAAGPGSVDGRHLLLVGAGPGLGMAVARRFAVGRDNARR
jgi:hypothetical protein